MSEKIFTNPDGPIFKNAQERLKRTTFPSRVNGASESPLELAVEILNRALEKDAAALGKLMKTRVRCNSKLAEDPDIVVRQDGKNNSLGCLGLINGLFAHTGKAIAMVADSQQNIVQKFVVVERRKRRDEDAEEML